VSIVASSPTELGLPEPLGVGAAVRRSGPRLVRNGFGPLAMFFAGWKLLGLGAGIAAAVIFGVAVFVHERRQGRPATVVRLALVLVAIRATVGIVSGSGSAYLATEIGIDTLLASMVLGSLASSRPFASWFAADVYAFPSEVLDSDTYRRAMRVITLAWGVYFLLRGLVRLTALLTLSTDSYALVVGLTDAPFLIALLAWSVYYSVGSFRRSAEWGPIIAAAEAPRQIAPPLG
jgi:intracellular septation protein A